MLTVSNAKQEILQEEEILRLYKNELTRQEGFRYLVKSYQERIYWHVRKIVINHEDADDVTQETFIKVFKNLDGFNGTSKLFTWMYRIATNEALTHLKKNKKHLGLDIDDVYVHLSEFITQGKNISGEEIELKLQKAILKLPHKQRLVFNMKYFDHLKYEEMAEITETSVGSLKASYHLAVKKIERELTED